MMSSWVDSSLGLIWTKLLQTFSYKSFYGHMCFLDLIDYFLSHVGEVFNYNFFKNFLSAFFLSSSFGTPITWKLVLLISSQRCLMLSSILFVLFPLFGSSAVICTILSYSSLLCSSASVILLLVPSRVFLISVLVLFISVCMFFISSMSLVIVLTVWIQCIFTVIIPNSLSGRLLISSLFIWSEFLLCSLICAVFLCLLISPRPNLLHMRSPFPML